MTDEQSLIFSKVLDTNLKVKELTEAYKWTEAREKIKELNALKKQLEESMGKSEYDLYIEMGRKMFA